MSKRTSEESAINLLTRKIERKSSSLGFSEWKREKYTSVVHKERQQHLSRNEKSIILKLQQARTRWLTAHFVPHPTRYVCSFNYEARALLRHGNRVRFSSISLCAACCVLSFFSGGCRHIRKGRKQRLCVNLRASNFCVFLTSNSVMIL